MITNKPKTKIEDSIETLMEHKYVKVGFAIVLSIGVLYLTSKVFNVVASTTDAFKRMTNSFRN